MTDDQQLLRQAIDTYLSEGRILHLATVRNSIPWMCHVWYAKGTRQHTIVFTSNKARRHSSEIDSNSVIAGGIVANVPDGLGAKVRGLSFEGRASQATGDATKDAYEAYAERWPRVRSMFSLNDIISGDTPMRMYVVTLLRVVLFDEESFPTSPRQELNLTA